MCAWQFYAGKSGYGGVGGSENLSALWQAQADWRQLVGGFMRLLAFDIAIPWFTIDKNDAPLAMFLVYLVAMLLLIAPGLLFLRYGHRARKEEILDNFDDEGTCLYFRCFHPETRVAAGPGARQSFISYYNSEYGPRRFIVPCFVCYSTAALLVFISIATARGWVEKGTADGSSIPFPVVLAIVGGYFWVAFDQVIRCMRADLTPRSLLIGAFRILIAVPLAYAISHVYPINDKHSEAAVAFLLGLFPTETVMMIGRRALAKLISTPGLPEDVQTEIQQLKSVDVNAAERFGEEGITSVLQLAYADPVRLAIRTNLGFSYIIGVAGEALLWTYLQKETPSLRRFGITGAYECRMLWEDLKTDSNPLAQNRARRVVEGIAAVLQVNTVEAVYNIFYQVAEDPYTEFARKIWAANLLSHNDEELRVGRGKK